MDKNSKQLSDFIVEKILEKKGERVISIYIGDKENAITDFFIICNAGTNTQARAIMDHITEKVYNTFSEKPFGKEGTENGFWILLDYVKVVVHIFQPQYREFYNIEQIWDGEIKEYLETF